MSILASLLPISAAMNAAANLLRARPGASHGPSGATFEKTLGQALVERWDTDGNGSLSIGEFGGKTAAFERFDRDGDGALTVGELDAGIAQMRRGQQLQAAVQEAMRLRDADHDGLLTRAESGFNTEQFDAVDADGDGLVSHDEMLAAYRRQA